MNSLSHLFGKEAGKPREKLMCARCMVRAAHRVFASGRGLCGECYAMDPSEPPKAAEHAPVITPERPVMRPPEMQFTRSEAIAREKVEDELMSKRQVYSEETKEKARRLFTTTSRTAADIAAELGTTAPTVYTWCAGLKRAPGMQPLRGSQAAKAKREEKREHGSRTVKRAARAEEKALVPARAQNGANGVPMVRLTPELARRIWETVPLEKQAEIIGRLDTEI